MTGGDPKTGTVSASIVSANTVSASTVSASTVSAREWDPPADHGPTGDADLPARLAMRGPDHELALRELHALMVRGCRHQVLRMRGMLPGFDTGACDDLAVAAADDAVVALLGKLHTFEGRSRFTTWAYKFAILQAATEVRRQAWSRREVPLEDPATIHSGDPAGGGRVVGGAAGLSARAVAHGTVAGPAELAEASELAAEVGRALDVALTAYQRRIAVALLVDEVPIDVLAERLGTTRGALYKTLSVARSRVRAHLVARGHLEPPRRTDGAGDAPTDPQGGESGPGGAGPADGGIRS